MLISIGKYIQSVMTGPFRSDHTGKTFAALGALHSVSSIVSTAVYNEIYPITLPIWPGICFIAGASLYVVPLVLIWYVT